MFEHFRESASTCVIIVVVNYTAGQSRQAVIQRLNWISA